MTCQDVTQRFGVSHSRSQNNDTAHDDQKDSCPVRMHPEIVELMNRRRGTEESRKEWYDLQVQRAAEESQCWNRVMNQRRVKSASDADRRRATQTIRTREIRSAKYRYHTPMTGQTPQSTPPNFDALNRDFVPLPQLLERPDVRRIYRKKSIREWENEVIKVVPERPSYTIESSVQVESLKSRRQMRPQTATGTKFSLPNPSLFYRVDRRKSKAREYMVSPGWASEQLVLASRHASSDRKRASQLCWG